MVSALCGFTAVESNHSLCCHHCVTRHREQSRAGAFKTAPFRYLYWPGAHRQYPSSGYRSSTVDTFSEHEARLQMGGITYQATTRSPRGTQICIRADGELRASAA